MKHKHNSTKYDRYCRHCGSKMVMTVKEEHDYYNAETGEKFHFDGYHYWVCPNFERGIKGIFSKHSKFNDEPFYG